MVLASENVKYALWRLEPRKAFVGNQSKTDWQLEWLMLLSSALSSKDRAPSSEGRRFVSAVRGDTAFHLSLFNLASHPIQCYSWTLVRAIFLTFLYMYFEYSQAITLSNPPYMLLILFPNPESKKLPLTFKCFSGNDTMILIRTTYRSMGNLLVVTPLKKMSLVLATINYLRFLREEGFLLTSLSMAGCWGAQSCRDLVYVITSILHSGLQRWYHA